MLMTGVTSGVVTPKDKTKLNSIANKNVRFITKSVVNSQSLAVSLTGGFASKELPNIKAWNNEQGQQMSSWNDKLDLEV